MKQSFLFILTLAALTACGAPKPESITITSFDGSESVPVTVELAVTREEQQKGLMERTTLAEGSGMMFVFEQQQPLGFWMRDTLIPLQILYFDEQGAFVSASDMEPCVTEVCENYYSAAPAKYALEVNPGFRETHGIAPGWRLTTESIATLEKSLERL